MQIDGQNAVTPPSEFTLFSISVDRISMPRLGCARWDTRLQFKMDKKCDMLIANLMAMR
jgi:hypothetical protein